MATKQQALVFYILVALALTASTFTQYRITGLPVGLSELILIACMVAHLPLGHGIHTSNRPHFFVWMMLAMFLAMIPGFFNTLIIRGSMDTANYNLIASTYIVVLVSYMHLGFDQRKMKLDQLVNLILIFSTCYFFFLLGMTMVAPELVYLVDDPTAINIGQSTFGRADDQVVQRMVGLSQNPNQLGLHALVVCVLAVSAFVRNGLMKTLVVVGSASAVGWLTGSDAFLFALFVLVVGFILSSFLLHDSVGVRIIAIIPVLFGAVLLYKPVLRVVEIVTDAGDQESNRYLLWANGIDAGLLHPIIGLGPGSWSGWDGPIGFEEAHNSAIDYFSNAGLIGTTILLIAIFGILYKTGLSKRSALLAGTLAIAVFGMFHNILRQPLAWIALYILYQLAASAHSGSSRSTVRRKARPSGDQLVV